MTMWATKISFLNSNFEILGPLGNIRYYHKNSNIHEVMQQTNLNNEIVIYQSEDGKTQLDVKLQGETVWLTQTQMSELFQTSCPFAINRIRTVPIGLIGESVKSDKSVFKKNKSVTEIKNIGLL